MKWLLGLMLCVSVFAEPTPQVSEPDSPNFRLSAGVLSNTGAVLPTVHIREFYWPSVAIGLTGLLTSGSDGNSKASLFSVLGTLTLFLESCDGWNISGGAGPGMFSASMRTPDFKVSDDQVLFLGLLSVGYLAALSENHFLNIGVGGIYITPPDSDLVESRYASLRPMASLDLGIRF